MVDVDRGRSPASAPSSPPAPKHDTAIDHPPVRSPRREALHTDNLLSPEIARLPPPRTPISVRSRYRDTSSEYYTAAWGSPYDRSERSPSPSSRSVRTALSQQIPSEDLSDSSPVPDFGLEHLIPSRLGGNFSLPQASRSPLGKLSAQPDEDEDLTPRSRTKRWVQLPRRDDSPKLHWWSDESGHESSKRSRSQHQRASSSVEARDLQQRPTLGHKAREDNQTLDQQSFWKTLRKEKAEDMTSLYESRWAATPPAEEPAKKDVGSGLKSSRWADTPSPEPTEQEVKSSLQASRWADTPPPQEEPTGEVPASLQASRWADKPTEGDAKEQGEGGAERVEADAEDSPPTASIDEKTGGVSEVEQAVSGETVETQDLTVDESALDEPKLGNGATLSESQAAEDAVLEDNSPVDSAATAPTDDTTPAAQMMPAPTSPTKARLDPPRMKKKVSWRGKNLVVSIPALDYTALGIRMPLSSDEVQARLKQFEDSGYHVHGFDVSPEVDSEGSSAHVRPIYPDETELRLTSTTGKATVNLPDLKKAKEHQEWLIEQKLKALGVDLGGDEPAPAPAQAQNMSRQSSGQFPGQTFSPPIPSTSAASMGRPGMVRGHSHTMSMASPISPLNGPMGHMRGHSVFAGPMGLQQGQQPPHQLQMPGMRAFSPPLQQPPQQSPIPGMQAFSPAFNRTGSPAQLAALRGEIPFARGPGSPLNPQMSMPSPHGYGGNPAEEQFRRQHGYSQSMQQPQMSSYFPSPSAHIQPTPTLPELPEEDDEDELAEEPEVQTEAQPEPEEDKREPEPEVPAYVPPQKRAQLNANIEVPTPSRGHSHNPSAGFERDILEAEKRQEAEKLNMIEVEYESSGRDSNPYGPSSGSWRDRAVEKDPLGMDISVQEAPRSHKKSASRFQVPTLGQQEQQLPPLPASSFSFNPGASFQPSFTFGASKAEQSAQPKFTHSRQQSSGNFNVAAPVFKPSGTAAPSVPKSDFNFSAPAFKPGAPAFEPSKSAEKNVIDELPKIFGDVKIADIVKPARRSKAIEIKRPEETRKSNGGSGTEQEDSDGRLMQSEDRIKRHRAKADDGGEVPQFAEPTPLPQPAGDLILKSQTDEDEKPELGPAVRESSAEPTAAELAAAQIANKVQTTDHAVRPSDSSAPAWKPSFHGHRSSASLSALAKPFLPSFGHQAEEAPAHKPTNSHTDISDLEEGEIREDEPVAASPAGSRSLSAEDDYGHAQHDSFPTFPQPPPAPFEPASARVNDFTNIEPSFDEIDAVMRQLNEADDGDQGKENVENSPSISTLPSPGSHPMKGVTYLPEWSRSDAPSPSPRRRSTQFQATGDSSFTVHDRSDSLERPTANGWPHVNRLNKDDDAPVSDWSGELSPPEQERLEQRSQFFDNRIDEIIGRVVEKRLQPLEDSLRNIQSAVAKQPGSQPLTQQRSSSAIESDADDEDESEEQRQRPISRGREKRLDQMKAIVMEALREQSPRKPSQSAYDLQELHTVLADMKMSFARAASSSLELDDIRAVVDEVVTKQSQSQALVPITMEDPSRQLSHSHSREASELETRLKETSAGLLEEADLRRASEEREGETKRMLRLAEEELELLRESNKDDDSRIVAAEHEREEMRSQLQAAEHAQRATQEQVKNLEAENAATYATLEEYRRSSHKWRQDIDQATHEREDLENTISDLEKQLEESQEAGSGMRRRLEKLHADMASAAGQLVSEKAAWKDKEEDLKASIEMQEAREAAHLKDRALLEDEVQGLRAGAAQATQAREVTDIQDRSLVEDELNRLRAGALEAVELRTTVDQMRASNASLDEMVQKFQAELTEQQALAARYEREFNDAREAGRAEVQRTRMAMEIDIEQANHQVNIVRAELEGEMSKVRSELENAKIEAETAKARHERFVEEEDEARREALRKVNHANSVALEEARQKHDASLQEMQKAHDRALGHALEDKQRSEYFLNQRLSLSDEKLQHFQDKVLLLEDKLEVAKSAASAAAARAQAPRAMPVAAPAQSARAAALPEKISPQALRESILVLQDQLQAREATIEKLQTQVDKEAPAKLKQRDDEISWLRELLSNRGEELTDLVNTLASPAFDRTSVRDAAIRIRANLQMEQQEKERFSGGDQNLPAQTAIASLSNFATPKASQLTSAFNKWRANMESSALKNAPRSSDPLRQRSNTPSRRPASKPSSSAGPSAPSYMHGLMTPPASNLRTTPSPETSNPLPPPQLSRPSSKAGAAVEPLTRPKSRQPSTASDAPTTPLFRSQSYDQDAEDHEVRMQDFEDEEGADEDEDLDVADDAPPAFRTGGSNASNRSLGDELEGLGDDGEDAAMA